MDYVDSIEGFETESFDPEVPSCQTSPGDTVPSCYATVHKDDYLTYPVHDMDDYILKTKIVTPVCPNNPYDRILFDYDVSSNTPTDASLNIPPPVPDEILTPEKPCIPVPVNQDVCPPCPACERCPEPVVDCKKIIHYKDQQYPVPLIDDFSKFSRF